jgi:hypothetical protein
MPVFTLVTDVEKVVESLRAQYGEFVFAMLYNALTDGGVFSASALPSRIEYASSCLIQTWRRPPRNHHPIPPDANQALAVSCSSQCSGGSLDPFFFHSLRPWKQRRLNRASHFTPAHFLSP